jgi:hypothetical protein
MGKKRAVKKAKKAVKKKVKKAAKKKTKRIPNPQFMKPVAPDAKLAAVVGSKPLPRTELTKKLWAYIKKNGLQDAKNRTSSRTPHRTHRSCRTSRILKYPAPQWGAGALAGPR